MKAVLLAINIGLLALLLLARPGVAQPGEEAVAPPPGVLEVTPIGAGPREVEPRKTVTTLFLITNSTPYALEVKPRTGAPRGWTTVTADSTIYLGPNEHVTSLVSLLVPHAAPAGEYRVSYVVSPVRHPELVDWCAVSIIVLPVTRLEVKLLSVPDFVVAGEELNIRFVVANRGNTDETLRLRTETALALPFVLQDQEIRVPPGETRPIDIWLKTNPRLNKVLRDNVTLIAESSQRQSQAHAACPIEIIPRVTGTEDRFARIPAMATLRGMTSRDGSASSRVQAELSGEGTFGPGDESRLSIMAKGPDAQNIGVLGRRDEYYLGYSTRKFEVMVGDHSYSVSQMVESHRYGRGIEVKATLRRFRIGAYTIRSSWDNPHERQTATCLDYSLDRSTALGINYLFRKSESGNHILGFEAKHAAAWNTDLEAEYAAGLGEDPGRNAYYLKLRTVQKRASGFLRLIHADPAFPGYFRDMEFVAGVVDLNMGKKSRLETSFKQERHNLNHDQTDTSIPTEREYLTRLDSRIKTTDVSVGWRTRSHENRLDDQRFDYDENVVRLGLGQRFNVCSYSAALEGGWIHNRLEDGMSQLQRYSASLNMRPTNRQTYGCYLSYDRSCIPGKTEKRYLTAGLNSSFRIGEGTLLDLGFRSNSHESGRGLGDNMFDITVSHRLANKHIVLARGYYRPWQSASGHDEAALSLEYSVPVGLPVAKRQNIGAVRGRIYDEITDLPVEDAIVWLDGITAVTDAKGVFVIPSVAKGDYNLRIDRSSIGIDRITTQKMPIPVAVAGGEETFVEIGVTHGASLRGRVMLYRLRTQGTMPSEAEEKDLVEDRGIPNILVELSDGVETRRVFTDIEGRFIFEEMRPGNWSLSVTEDNLPEHTRLEKTSYQFSPMPGEQKTALVKVVPVRRPIQILEEGGVLREEKIGE